MWKWILPLFLICMNLKAETQVVAFAASTRKNSLNQLLLNQALSFVKKKGATVQLLDLNQLAMPFYGEDLEKKQGLPGTAKILQNAMIHSNLVIIASPEYNGSIPGLLKNALDWATRNDKGEPTRAAFKNKKFILLSASPGSGGNRAIRHLKEIIENIGGTVVGEFSLTQASVAFDDEGQLKNSHQRLQLEQIIAKSLYS